MKKLSAILVIILFVMAGCGENEQPSGDFITVDVRANYPKKELILQDFMDVEYIPLETNAEFVTSASIEAIGKDIMIFINSARGNSDILIFDRTGKGLRKINRYGLGSEEYTNIQDIILDEENGEMHVNSTFLGKMLVYDLFGNFKRSFKHKEGVSYGEMFNFDKDNLICYNDYFSFENGDIKAEKRNCFLIVSKQDGSIKEVPIPYEEKKVMILLRRGGRWYDNWRQGYS